MKDRALRRHQEFKVKIKKQNDYNSCIGDLPPEKRDELENNIEKLRKVCVSSRLDEHSQKAAKKTLQEMKHDITMKEQLHS
ncbi:MAG: hypothetical protein ABIJ59_13600 [Pseudomonadota bacterium]